MQEDTKYTSILLWDFDGVINIASSQTPRKINIPLDKLLKAVFSILEDNNIHNVLASQRICYDDADAIEYKQRMFSALDGVFGKNRKYLTQRDAEKIKNSAGNKNTMLDQLQQLTKLPKASISLIDDNINYKKTIESSGYPFIHVDNGNDISFIVNILLRALPIDKIYRGIKKYNVNTRELINAIETHALFAQKVEENRIQLENLIQSDDYLNLIPEWYRKFVREAFLESFNKRQAALSKEYFPTPEELKSIWEHTIHAFKDTHLSFGEKPSNKFILIAKDKARQAVEKAIYRYTLKKDRADIEKELQEDDAQEKKYGILLSADPNNVIQDLAKLIKIMARLLANSSLFGQSFKRFANARPIVTTLRYITLLTEFLKEKNLLPDEQCMHDIQKNLYSGPENFRKEEANKNTLLYRDIINPANASHIDSYIKFANNNTSLLAEIVEEQNITFDVIHRMEGFEEIAKAQPLLPYINKIKQETKKYKDRVIKNYGSNNPVSNSKIDTIKKLEETINAKNVAIIRRIENFKALSEDPKTREVLTSHSDHAGIRFLKITGMVAATALTLGAALLIHKAATGTFAFWQAKGAAVHKTLTHTARKAAGSA